MTESPDGGVRDRRRPPFFYQTVDAVAAIRSWYAENALTRLSTALGVYMTLTEHANRRGGEQARGGFTAYRAEIAADAGVSADTLDRYVRDFEQIGVLVVERRTEGKVSLPNLWTLVEPPPAPCTPSRTDAAGVAAPVRPIARVPFPEPKKDLEETPPESPRLVAMRPAKVERRTVTDEEFEFACAVLAIFNGLAGTRYSSRDFIAKIVMRAREHPDLDLEVHERINAAALAHPWWTGPASPSVVYGNSAQFERCAHAAAAPQERTAADLIESLGPPTVEGRAEVVS